MSAACFLLVDDLEENLLSLEALLRRDDLVLLKARSGDEALELLLQNDVALALIDVQMPGLNGFELAELMRGNERTRRVPIIFVTAGSSDNQRRFRGYEAGAVDFIQKPIEPDVLKSKADVFFELGRQRQQIAIQRDELLTQAESLREADRRKDEFLATLAHELRNPLAPLRQGLDVLQRNPDSDVAEQVRKVMDRQLAHLVRLIDDLLDVSRVITGKVELRKDRIQVADVVCAAVEASRATIDAGRHRLNVNLPPTELWLEADLTRLSQVVSNLLTNAAKYTPENGEITVFVTAADDDAVIEVSDTGIGIPAEMQSKVFELFTQVDSSSDRAQGGLGIGLALVKQLVALHAGSVSAHSSGTDKGSTITVRLPLASGPPDAHAPAIGTMQPGSTRALKVLVVDDNVDVAQTVGWLLEEIGHEHKVVLDGRLALQAARDFGPDIILLDIGMPGMDGYEVCRVIRREERFKETPIIAQSGYGASQDKNWAKEAGFTSHLTKPVGLEDLEKVFAIYKN